MGESGHVNLPLLKLQKDWQVCSSRCLLVLACFMPQKLSYVSTLTNTFYMNFSIKQSADMPCMLPLVSGLLLVGGFIPERQDQGVWSTRGTI